MIVAGRRPVTGTAEPLLPGLGEFRLAYNAVIRPPVNGMVWLGGLNVKPGTGYRLGTAAGADHPLTIVNAVDMIFAVTDGVDTSVEVFAYTTERPGPLSDPVRDYRYAPR